MCNKNMRAIRSAGTSRCAERVRCATKRKDRCADGSLPLLFILILFCLRMTIVYIQIHCVVWRTVEVTVRTDHDNERPRQRLCHILTILMCSSLILVFCP